MSKDAEQWEDEIHAFLEAKHIIQSLYGIGDRANFRLSETQSELCDKFEKALDYPLAVLNSLIGASMDNDMIVSHLPWVEGKSREEVRDDMVAAARAAELARWENGHLDENGGIG